MKPKYIEAIRRGRGGLKHYSYWASGIRINTKKAISEALNLKLKVIRKDKIMFQIEEYNYKTKKFEQVKK